MSFDALVAVGGDVADVGDMSFVGFSRMRVADELYHLLIICAALTLTCFQLTYDTSPRAHSEDVVYSGCERGRSSDGMEESRKGE